MRFSVIPFFLLSVATSSVLASPQPKANPAPAAAVDGSSDLESRTFFCPSGTNWKITKCCPWDAYESHFKCVCNDNSKSLSADGKKCENKCSVSGWKFCHTQCCPPGSDEKNGKCVCDDSKKQLVGSGNNKKCVDKCESGHHYCNTKCCPEGASEDKWGNCVCDNKNQQLSKDGKKCENKCPNGWTQGASQCCPPGSVEEHGQCKCTDSKKTIQGTGDNKKCEYNCPSGTEFKSTKCCPHDSFELHGQCQCNDSTKKLSSDGTKCVSTCPNPGEKYTNGVCCKSYLTGKDGKCVCPTNGQIDNGSSCSPCPDGKNYNWVKKQCDPACPQGTSYKITRGGKGVCCRSGHKACETVCCSSDQEEVGHSGKCCKPGSTLDSHGKCLEPSYAPKKRRSVANIFLADQMMLGAGGYFGMDANADGDLCPGALAACPIEGAAEGDYECLDTQSDLQSCGGCASLGEGKDCTLEKGAKWMGCVKGQCEVYSCAKGFKLVDGACIAV